MTMWNINIQELINLYNYIQNLYMYSWMQDLIVPSGYINILYK